MSTTDDSCSQQDNKKINTHRQPLSIVPRAHARGSPKHSIALESGRVGSSTSTESDSLVRSRQKSGGHARARTCVPTTPSTEAKKSDFTDCLIAVSLTIRVVTERTGSIKVEYSVDGVDASSPLTFLHKIFNHACDSIPDGSGSISD